jgi:hypothetical protein
MSDSPKPKRRWFQFSLRTLLLLTALSAVLLGMWTTYVAPYRAQRRAATALQTLGATLNERQADGPAWVRTLVGEKDFVKVHECWIGFKPISDNDFRHVKALTKLQTLHLMDLDISDAGLAHLKGLTNLRTLTLYKIQVTDAGLAHLKGLTNLHLLVVANETQVTDAGLADLKKALPNLDIIYARNGRVVDVLEAPRHPD